MIARPDFLASDQGPGRACVDSPRRILRFTANRRSGFFPLVPFSSLANRRRVISPSRKAVHLALQQNRTLKIARFKVQENEYRKAAGPFLITSRV